MNEALLADVQVQPAPAVTFAELVPPLDEKFCTVGLIAKVQPGACVTVKVRSTGVAAAKLAFPAWVAWMVQAPTDTRVTEDEATVQTPVVRLE